MFIEYVTEALFVLLQLAFIVLVIDFGSGLIHWAEDTFFSETTPIIGKLLIKPNVEHHRAGSKFLQKSWLESSWDLALIGVVILAVAHATGHLTWQVLAFVLIGMQSNQIHKWAHTPEHLLPAPVRLLQKARILQRPQHHWQHHRGQKITHYCAVTDHVNPILEKIDFWRRLERVLAPVLPTPRRPDLAYLKVRG